MFINRQFVRLAQGHYPEEKVINEVGEFVLEYVSKHDYFPRARSEAEWRYNHPQEGLSDMEKLALMGPLEFRLKVQLLINVSFNQIHLATWGALLWCWTDEGGRYVNFVQETAAKNESLQRHKEHVALDAAYGY